MVRHVAAEGVLVRVESLQVRHVFRRLSDIGLLILQVRDIEGSLSHLGHPISRGLLIFIGEQVVDETLDVLLSKVVFAISTCTHVLASLGLLKVLFLPVLQIIAQSSAFLE